MYKLDKQYMYLLIILPLYINISHFLNQIFISNISRACYYIYSSNIFFCILYRFILYHLLCSRHISSLIYIQQMHGKGKTGLVLLLVIT